MNIKSHIFWNKVIVTLELTLMFLFIGQFIGILPFFGRTMGEWGFITMGLHFVVEAIIAGVISFLGFIGGMIQVSEALRLKSKVESSAKALFIVSTITLAGSVILLIWMNVM
ncbi:MAG: hypothetical protein K9M75_05060 [Phycisphaerae bacterium]|nr:hypothetical protein [Phycisphaerae bacterium]